MSKNVAFRPKLLSTLKGYNFKTFTSDLIAGGIVGVVALPLAIAFAIASGVPPEKGLITAIVAGFLISALGGSRVQIGGPTGAFVVIVYDIVQKYGLDGLIISTIMAGVILMIMGFSKFGSIIKFIPYPIVVGFTSGIAVLILFSQINDIAGLGITSLPSDFIEKMNSYIANIGNFNFDALLIGIISLVFMLAWARFKFRLPGSFIIIVLTTAIVAVFNIPVETIESRFGEIPSSIPMPSLMSIDFETIKNLIVPATTIALLGAIESLLSAVVADGVIGGRHRSNMELVAQGVANIGSGIFGGIPATGAIARTMVNIKNGGKTPVAGIIHSLVLLLIMLLFGSFAKLIPMAALAAILIVVSINMFEWKEFANIRKSPVSDVIVMLTTFILTVVFDLTLALQIGMLMAVFLFMRRMALVTNVGVITRELDDTEETIDDYAIDRKVIPHGVDVYEINGPFFFGAATKFRDTLDKMSKPPKVRIIRMRNVPAIDQTGIHFLEEIFEESVKQNIDVVFSGMHAQPYRALEHSGFLTKITPENNCANIDLALIRAREIIEKKEEKIVE
ncbi:MAG: SulP family inorganic anion transporter [Candidatus Kapabacteria bacterium]|nr:SulP family inorganic anion transporter [Candidatus Kapabacteria bacterium]